MGSAWLSHAGAVGCQCRLFGPIVTLTALFTFAPIRWGICEQPVTPVVEGHGLIKRAEGMASGRKDYERAGGKIYFPSARLGGVGQLGFIAHFFGLRLFRAT